MGIGLACRDMADGALVIVIEETRRSAQKTSYVFRNAP